MTLRQLLPSKWHKTSSPQALIKNRSGQVLIEYLLLLVIVSSLGAIIIKDLVSRDADEPGLLVAKWHSIIKTIAEDNPEE
jgi:hypothetical protein